MAQDRQDRHMFGPCTYLVLFALCLLILLLFRILPPLVNAPPLSVFVGRSYILTPGPP